MALTIREPGEVMGNTRMDAALDAMRQFGFEEKLIRETVEELLHVGLIFLEKKVYEGNQGWPFIEVDSYKLLIETILSKQQTCVEDKDDTRRDVVGETSSAAMPTAAIQESNDETFESNVETSVMNNSMTESTKPSGKSRYRPCYGWISDDDNVDLIYFPVPPLPRHIEKLIGKSVALERPRRKSRWDEKPDDM